MEQKNSTKSIVGLVLGIVALVMSFIAPAFNWPGLIVGYVIGLAAGIVGIIMAVMGKKEAPSGMATGALVCSIIGTVFCGIMFISCASCAGAAACAINDAINQLNAVA